MGGGGECEGKFLGVLPTGCERAGYSGWRVLRVSGVGSVGCGGFLP